MPSIANSSLSVFLPEIDFSIGNSSPQSRSLRPVGPTPRREGAEGYLFFAFRWPQRNRPALWNPPQGVRKAEFHGASIPQGREAEKQKDPAKADYFSNSFTIRTMPSLIRGTLKLKSSPNLRPDNLRYVPRK